MIASLDLPIEETAEELAELLGHHIDESVRVTGQIVPASVLHERQPAWALEREVIIGIHDQDWLGHARQVDA